MQVNPMGEGFWLWLKGYLQGCRLQPRPSTGILPVDKVATVVAGECALKKTGSNLFVAFEKAPR